MTSPSRAPVVLGVDPGLASCGYALVRLEPDREEVLCCGVIRTEKSRRRRQVLSSDDNVRRVRELHAGLRLVLAPSHRIVAVCAESMSFPRAAGSAHKLGLAWGVVVALALELGAAVVQASPQELKRALTGRRDASKEDVLAALTVRYGLEALSDIFELPKSQREHSADALGAVVACLDSELLRGFRRLAA